MGLTATARDSLMYFSGLGFLTLAKAKNLLQGYTSPKTFPLSEIDRSIDYDLNVVDEWLSNLAAYAGDGVSVRGKNVLELGPGSDMGVGVYLLAKGAASYGALDVHDLMSRVPDDFYRALLQRIQRAEPGTDIEALRPQIKLRGAPDARLKVVVRTDFDLVAAFGQKSIDLVFSQAAFEHFDDVVRTVEQLSAVCRPGAMIVAEIDLKTHSRWIRDKDPNNIYRYPNWIYELFRFRGTPNRVRPYQYQGVFERFGWRDVSIKPVEVTTPVHPNARVVHKQFRGEQNQMDYLSVVLCARKA